jgi:uncharacterized protein DUF1501
MQRLTSRRRFLRIGAFGSAFTLVDLLRARADQKAKGIVTRAKSAILIILPGGPSHLDTWDPKPDAPSEFRGEFRSIRTTVPGVRLCEHFPLQAKMLDKLNVIRTVVGMSEEHADVQILTGYESRVAKAEGRPSIGSVVSKLVGGRLGMPPFFSLRGMTIGSEPGFLGIRHRPFTPGGEAEANLRLPTGVNSERLAERRSLIHSLDRAAIGEHALESVAGLSGFHEQAFDVITSGRVREALNLRREDPDTMERYDRAEVLLKARRLVEAGVGCVTVSLGGSWDTHTNNFKSLKDLLPPLDRGISVLVQDLHDRGLAEDVVVLAWGEFGRTPKVNAQAGRDHWTPVMSAVLAGGGLKSGQAIGMTDRRGERPVDRPYSVQQVLSTVYKAIGIDPATTLTNNQGRPVYLLDDREPVRELF